MKRDWEAIREVLIEVEALDQSRHETIDYIRTGSENDYAKAHHGILLWREGFIRGVDASDLAGDAVIAQELTWKGHDLLDTMRSKPLWDRIQAAAKEKGLELTFDTVKALQKIALAAILSQ